MTWREHLVVRILLLVARIVAPDDLAVEIKHLANHIATWTPKEAATGEDAQATKGKGS